MSSAAQIPVLNPETGKVHMIPTNMVDKARAAGGKPVAQMIDPEGKHRYVPMDMVQEAQKHGGTLVPFGSKSGEEIAQEETGITPSDSPVMNALNGVGRTVKGIFTSPYEAYRAATDAPKNPEEEQAQKDHGALGLAYHRMITQPAEAAEKTSEQLSSTGHPIAAEAAKLGKLPFVGAMGQNLGQRAAAGDVTGAVTEGLSNALLPEALKKGAAVAAPVLSDTARGIINKSVVGARQNDFARDANMGRGYLKAGIGPRLGMHGIADASGEALDKVGQQIGNEIDARTAPSNTLGQTGSGGYQMIPAQDVANEIGKVIHKAHADATAPGVLGNPQQYVDLAESFHPALKAAAAKGGFTPRELWDIRHTMNKHLNWGDQSKINLTKVQQQISGKLGGMLEDRVPGLEDLNETYKDLTKLHTRASQRAATGQHTLSGAAGKIGAVGLGALAGHATPEGAAAGAAAAALANSVPVKTAVATGLNAVAEHAPTSSVPLAPATLATEAGNTMESQNDKEDRATGAESVQTGTSEGNSTPAVTPETHSFSRKVWRDANPDAEAEEAAQAEADAVNAGHPVVD